MQSLSQDLLPQGSFTVKTLAQGDKVDVYVFLQQELIATATVDRKTRTSQVTLNDPTA